MEAFWMWVVLAILFWAGYGSPLWGVVGASGVFVLKAIMAELVK